MQNIFLIGMPSSGKTTLGKELAKRIRYRFLDTDHLIEKDLGMTVSEIFSAKGEPFFRECESKTLRSIRPESKLIISTGGGMPCYHDNISYINSHGISVFLNVPIEDIHRRIVRHNTHDRPLFNTEDNDLLLKLKERFALRESIYRQANYILESPIVIKDILAVLENSISQ